MASRADIHLHTKYSGLAHIGFLRFPESVSDPKDVVRTAKANGLDTICVTDHNSIKGALIAQEFAKEYDGVSVIVGEEVSTAEGEVIGLYLNELVPKDLSAAETVDQIKAQGGLVVAPHPFSLHVPALGLLVDKLPIDGLEVLNAGHVDTYSNHKALEHAQSGRWALVGGSDSHSLRSIGCAYTVFDGQGPEDLRRAILNKTTKAEGDRIPMVNNIQWSLEVVMESDRLIIRSMLHRELPGDIGDPVIDKVRELPTHKKIAALVASLAYFTPPVPFIAMITGEKVLNRINSVPVHESNGGAPVIPEIRKLIHDARGGAPGQTRPRKR
jgi:predicted metal-dependent phosphoesterase TrpH